MKIFFSLKEAESFLSFVKSCRDLPKLSGDQQMILIKVCFRLEEKLKEREASHLPPFKNNTTLGRKPHSLWGKLQRKEAMP